MHRCSGRARRRQLTWDWSATCVPRASPAALSRGAVGQRGESIFLKTLNSLQLWPRGFSHKLSGNFIVVGGAHKIKGAYRHEYIFSQGYRLILFIMTLKGSFIWLAEVDLPRWVVTKRAMGEVARREPWGAPSLSPPSSDGALIVTSVRVSGWVCFLLLHLPVVVGVWL